MAQYHKNHGWIITIERKIDKQMYRMIGRKQTEI